jgi:hypothetical protein
MARRVFYSFHYAPDSWRASQVRNMGILDGNLPATDNDWEAIKRGGDNAIRRWIDGQLQGRSCTVVLIGNQTAGRKWIRYEIESSWNNNKGLLGIYVHNLRDASARQAYKGGNPFEQFSINSGQYKLSTIVRAYDPPYTDSRLAYNYIHSNLASWIEEAVSIRSRF